MKANFMAPASSWADLSPDLLIDVSGRLHDVADFVRFHAVCCSWRATAALRSPATPPTFAPWLLGLCDGQIIHYPRVSSSTASTDHDVVHLPPHALDGEENWVARADGTAAWLFVAKPDPRLIDLLSGEVTPLPRFPDDDDDIQQTIGTACGTIYKDGTVFLYSTFYTAYPIFTAAILRPGDVAWKIIKRILKLPIARHLCGVYHGGKVLLCVGPPSGWCVLTQGGGGTDGFVTMDAIDDIKYYPDWNYVLESGGELLWASVLVKRPIIILCDNDGPWRLPDTSRLSDLSVMVHALEEGEKGEMRWAARDGKSLRDRVIFLGHPVSFAMDSTQLDNDGGCVYFVYGRDVFRYSLLDGEVKLIKRLHPRWHQGPSPRVWLQPQPLIAPIQEIQGTM